MVMFEGVENFVGGWIVVELEGREKLFWRKV